MKFYANKLALCSAAAFCLAMSATFIACGDENTTEVTEQTGMDVLAKGEKLPDCTKDNAGDMLYVADSAAAYYCVDGKWTVLNGKNGENGQQGASPEAKDGAGCSAKANEKGIEVSCDGKVIGTINNGEPGASATGNDGANCTVVDNHDGSVDVTCGSGEGEKKVTLYKAMCGTKGYDPAEKKFCVDEVLYDLCDGNVYNPKKSECVEKRILVTPGKMNDPRDNNREYNTVTIEGTYKDASQNVVAYKATWMAENLNYSVDYSWCNENKEENCTTYGRLYIWDAAMSACPTDWHLPSYDEWETLFKVVDAEYTASSNTVSTKLKSASGWDTYEVSGKSGNGEDSFGFAVLPAGYSNSNGGNFSYVGKHAYIWISTGVVGNIASFWDFDYVNASVVNLHDSKYMGNSVRCIKGAAVDAGSSSSVASSSSTEGTQSSSSEESSTSVSSSSGICPAGKTCTYAPTAQLTPGKSYGDLLDTRDYQVYKTITIGSQTWMAQNLNYAYKKEDLKFDYEGDKSDSISWCYDNKPSNCEAYGRLYTWAAAVDSVGIVDENGVAKGCGNGVDCEASSATQTKMIRGICPVGWHLPSKAEWETLLNYAGDLMYVSAGEALKSIEGWRSGGDGSEYYGLGFSALPAGYRTVVGGVGGFRDVINSTSFWSASQGGSDGKDNFKAYNVNLFYDEDGDGLNYEDDKIIGSSVRCLMD